MNDEEFVRVSGVPYKVPNPFPRSDILLKDETIPAERRLRYAIAEIEILNKKIQGLNKAIEAAEEGYTTYYKAWRAGKVLLAAQEKLLDE